MIVSGKWMNPGVIIGIDPDIMKHPFIERLTTRHVLTHQSGFSNWRSQNPDGKLRFNFEPGSEYLYSGEAFEYLRIALENKFGISTITLMDSLFLYSA